MICVRINGEEKNFSDAITLQKLIEEMKIVSTSVAVAINSEVIPRSEFEKTRIKNQDQVEIIHAVGGG